MDNAKAPPVPTVEVVRVLVGTLAEIIAMQADPEDARLEVIEHLNARVSTECARRGKAT